MHLTNTEIGGLICEMNVGIFSLDLKTERFSCLSKGILQFTAHAVTEETPSHEILMNACHPGDKNIVTRILSIVQEEKLGSFQDTIRLRDNQGAWRRVFVTAQMIPPLVTEDHGIVVGIMIPVDWPYNEKSSLPGGKLFRMSSYPQRIKALSSREKQIMSMIARGYTCAAIANELSLSFFTIDTYRKRLLKKLELPNIAALSALAGEYGMI